MEVRGGVIDKEAGGGVGVAGESLRPLPMDFNASWNGSIEDGCATLRSGSLLTGTGAFLKLGNFAFGFGAEKNDESERASLTAIAGFVSFFSAVGFNVDMVGVIATFFAGGGAFADGRSTGFRFLSLESARDKISACPLMQRTDVTHPQFDHFLPVFGQFRPTGAICVPSSMPCP